MSQAVAAVTKPIKKLGSKLFGDERTSQQPTRGQARVGTFRSEDIERFEQAGSLLAGRQGSIRDIAPTQTTGGDVGAVEGQERVNRLVSLFGARQSEIARRKRQPGRSLLTGAGAR